VRHEYFTLNNIEVGCSAFGKGYGKRRWCLGRGVARGLPKLTQDLAEIGGLKLLLMLCCRGWGWAGFLETSGTRIRGLRGCPGCFPSSNPNPFPSSRV